MTQQIHTANRLGDGRVVFLTVAGTWSTGLAGADIAAAAAVAHLEAKGREDEAARLVVGAYLIEVAESDGIVEPLRLRERIRTGGPTVGNDVGRAA
ncbi:MAG: DUF2849 domain-containing protein [Alphaproteobacteria bacterium]|nr:DUF2849 domain-containing protein [Alphaproteobacteria bacterium]